MYVGTIYSHIREFQYSKRIVITANTVGSVSRQLVQLKPIWDSQGYKSATSVKLSAMTF